MVVALDAMGGDHGPAATVPAALDATSKGDIAIALVGDPDNVSNALAEHGVTNHPLLQVIPSDGVVEETDNPAMVFRSKPRASIFVCSGLVKDGESARVCEYGFYRRVDSGSNRDVRHDGRHYARMPRWCNNRIFAKHGDHRPRRKYRCSTSTVGRFWHARKRDVTHHLRPEKILGSHY